MITTKRKNILIVVYATLLTAALIVLVRHSFADRIFAVYHREEPRHITEWVVQIADGEPFAATLPTKIDGLAPRTPVTLTAQAEVSASERFLIKSVFAPTCLYINGDLKLEVGQEGSYPAYMNDPPTTFMTVLTDVDGTAKIRMEYISLSQRSTLSLPALVVGSGSAIGVEQLRIDGFSMAFALMLIFLGLSMALVSFTVTRMDSSGTSFLWLGLFSLSAGIWVLGECDFSAFLIPYPVLLHNMTYVGLFFMTIPLLHFGLVILNPKSRLLIQIMLAVHYISVAAALILQFFGRVDFIRSLYWFHIIVPLGFVVLAFCLVWEHFRHNNPGAKRFAPAVILLAASTVMEVLNYWLRWTGGLTMFFQLGVLAFVISLSIVSGYYVRQSLSTAAKNTRLEYEMAAINRQLALQRMQYRKIEEHDAAIKAQRHDLRHHLAALRELNTQPEKLLKYIDTLTQKIPTGKEIQLCENYAVNAVAVYYAAAAKAQNIQTDLQFAIPAELEQMVESDLCIIVGNLLENAVEACTRMTDGERFIRLDSCLECGNLNITVDNSFSGSVRKKDGIFLSSKREGEGTGLSSVAAVAKKYDGAARFETKDGVFQASVYVRLEGADNER